MGREQLMLSDVQVDGSLVARESALDATTKGAKKGSNVTPTPASTYSLGDGRKCSVKPSKAAAAAWDQCDYNAPMAKSIGMRRLTEEKE